MATSKTLTDFLQGNLNKVQPPGSYEALRRKLEESRPAHVAPVIKQSPENSLKIERED
jgi:hypothetical protein